MKENVEEKKGLSVEDKFLFVGLLVGFAVFIVWFVTEYGQDLQLLFRLLTQSQ